MSGYHSLPSGSSQRAYGRDICSTSIRHILAVRKSTLLQINTLIRQLAEISAMTESIGGKTALDWAMKQDFRCGCWLMEKPETAMKAITHTISIVKSGVTDATFRDAFINGCTGP